MDNREDFDVKSVTHTGGSGVQLVVGRARLLGFGVGQKDQTGGGTPVVQYQGTIILSDSSSGAGVTRIEFPIVGQVTYPTTIFTSFADEDAYVLFENGIHITETVESGMIAPLASYNVYITYG